MPLIRHLGPVFFLASYLSSAPVWAQVGAVELETIPSLNQIRPLSGPVKIVLSLSGTDGKALEQGRLYVRLVAPPPALLFSTDLPLVESAELLEMNLPVSKGRAAWQYVFPIRGMYRLEVRMTGEAGQEIERVFEMGIKENRLKLFYLGLFIVALFFLGFVAGRLFTVFLLLLVLNVAPSFGEAATKVGGENELAAELEVEAAEVGLPSQIRWRLTEPETGEPFPARLTLTIMHLEKGRPVFILDNISTEGEFSLRFHFTDGAQYRVTSVAHLEGGRQIRQEQTVTVNAKELPRKAVLPSLLLFLTVIALGLVAGRLSRRQGRRA